MFAKAFCWKSLCETKGEGSKYEAENQCIVLLSFRKAIPLCLRSGEHRCRSRGSVISTICPRCLIKGVGSGAVLIIILVNILATLKLP